MSGNARGPSTAFNLLFRLAQLRPTSNEIRTMLDHADSPYIRAVRARGGEKGGRVTARPLHTVFAAQPHAVFASQPRAGRGVRRASTAHA